MPFDSYRRKVEDAPLKGEGVAYAGLVPATPYVLHVTRPQLEAMLATLDEDDTARFCLTRWGERGMGRRTHIFGVREYG